MISQFKALQTRMVKKAEAEAPRKRTCPKCKRTRDLKKFGFRTQHARNGKPERTMVQSYCRDCRKGKPEKSSTH